MVDEDDLALWITTKGCGLFMFMDHVDALGAAQASWMRSCTSSRAGGSHPAHNPEHRTGLGGRIAFESTVNLLLQPGLAAGLRG